MIDFSIAAPQPTPKHFTDEELKQQYGIHLATRLQADADGKESKWADIDDDEDDWAPETIEWNDGTKIDLSQTNAAALLAEEQARAAVAKEREEEERKAKLAAQAKPMTTVGPNATVLKPRSAAQPKSGGLVMKPLEKPTLVAKPAAPAPVRSPWAALPPVDKVPPVEINPPTQSTVSKPQQTEVLTNHATAPQPQQPAMEIAADDFTRTRRDNQNGGLGQLYNAQSGQYEPANAGRRGSVRKEQNFRPPSLLQRGSANDPQGPAEPSAAFQTHRSGSQQDHPSWNRRASSTVSGESGPQGRRTSMNKGSDFSRIPADLLQQRRESQPLVSPSTPGPRPDHLQSAVQSPSISHAQTIQEAHAATDSPYRSKTAGADAAHPGQRDDVAVQKALMKERRELAIKRRKEQEEQEAAAKKERIRIRMESLGMAPLEEEKKEMNQPEKKDIEKKEAEPKQPAKFEKQDIEKPASKPDGPQTARQPQDLPNSVLRSPPKPPVPHASGTPQQYGMIKVHGTPANNAPQATIEPTDVEKTVAEPLGQKISPPSLETKSEIPEPSRSPLVNGITAASKHPDVPVYRAPDKQNQNLVRETRHQPWSNGQRDQNAYGGWNGQNVARDQSVSNSVWGTTNPRTLGNGTFDRSIQRPQSRPQDQFASPALAPIGPPKHVQRQRDAPESRANEINQAPPVEDFQTIPTFPPIESPASSSIKAKTSGQDVSRGKDVSPVQVGTGTPSVPQMANVERPSRGPAPQQTGLAAWGNFYNTDLENNRQLAQQNAARLAEDARNGVQRPEPQFPTMNEKWRHVKADEDNAQRHLLGVSRAQNAHDKGSGPQINGDSKNPSFVNSSGMPPPMAAGMGRGSRFFPAAGAHLQPQYQGAMRFPPGYRRSSSPPPPEDESHYHPAYAREHVRPLVRFPLVKEVVETRKEIEDAPRGIDDMTPKVKLPPTIVTPTQSPHMSEVRAIPIRAASQPLVNNPSWQDRFNGLLGVKKTSPDRKFAQVADGFSATKVPLDSPSVQLAASVSLPKQSEQPIRRVLEPASKLFEDEEALFENREFGSLPAVTIPTKAPEVGWIDAKTQRKGHNKQSKVSKEVEAASKDTLIEKEMVVNGSVLIFVNMLGMGLSKSVPLPRSSTQDNMSGTPRQRNISGNPKPNKSFKARDNSASFNHNQKISQGVLPKSIPPGGPPQPRGHTSRNHPAWGPRTANAVH